MYDETQPGTVIPRGWVEVKGPQPPQAKQILEEAKANQRQVLPSPSSLSDTVK